jgi:hypothetical protein
MCVWDRGAGIIAAHLVLLATVNHLRKLENSKSDYAECKILRFFTPSPLSSSGTQANTSLQQGLASFHMHALPSY